MTILWLTRPSGILTGRVNSKTDLIFRSGTVASLLNYDKSPVPKKQIICTVPTEFLLADGVLG